MAERSHLGSGSMGAGNLLVEEARSLSNSASNSPVVSPKLTQRGLTGVVSPSLPGTSSPRVLSASVSPRTSLSPRPLWGAAVASPDKKARTHSDADRLSAALTEELLSEAQKDAAEIHKARDAVAKSSVSPLQFQLPPPPAAVASVPAAVPSLEEALELSMEGSPSRDGSINLDSYEISHEDITAPTTASRTMLSSNGARASLAGGVMDGFELDSSLEELEIGQVAPPSPKPPKPDSSLPKLTPPPPAAATSQPPARSASDEQDYDDAFDELLDDDEPVAKPAVAPRPAPGKPGEKPAPLQHTRVLTTQPFVLKYLQTVWKAMDDRAALSAASSVEDSAVQAGGGHGELHAPDADLFDEIEEHKLYFERVEGDDSSLPRAFVANHALSPFPFAAQRAFHRLLFDSLCESAESYRKYWTRNVREPWFAHQRLLGTVLGTATAATAAAEQEDSEADDEFDSDADEEVASSLPRIRTHMRQIGMEHGVALVAHESLPTRADETLDQARARISAHVASRVAHMESVSLRTPSLATSIAAAA